MKGITNLLYKITFQAPPKQNDLLSYIDRQKLKNHFFLVLNQPYKITSKMELKQAVKDLVLVRGWRVDDLIIVFTHALTILILATPVLLVLLVERVQYSVYSLFPSSFNITAEDTGDNVLLIYYKIIKEAQWVQIIFIASGAFLLFALIDLFQYYFYMSFPQESYFMKEKKNLNNVTRYFQKYIRMVMWTFALLSLMFIFFYLIICLIWLILGAIVEPTIFLPTATGAATLIAAISSKYAKVVSVIEQGFKQVNTLVSAQTGVQINDMLKKMNLSENSLPNINTDALLILCATAAKLQIMDRSTYDELQDKAVQLVKNS